MASLCRSLGVFNANPWRPCQSARDQRDHKELFGAAPSLWPLSPGNREQPPANTHQPVRTYTFPYPDWSLGQCGWHIADQWLITLPLLLLPRGPLWVSKNAVLGNETRFYLTFSYRFTWDRRFTYYLPASIPGRDHLYVFECFHRCMDVTLSVAHQRAVIKQLHSSFSKQPVVFLRV